MSEIEDRVIARIRSRAAAGLVKYGTTMERTDLSRLLVVLVLGLCVLYVIKEASRGRQA